MPGICEIGYISDASPNLPERCNNNDNNNNNNNINNDNKKCRGKLDAEQKTIIPERIIYSKNICARIPLNFCKKKTQERSMFQWRM